MKRTTVVGGEDGEERREKIWKMEGGGQKVRKAEILPNTNGTLRTGK